MQVQSNLCNNLLLLTQQEIHTRQHKMNEESPNIDEDVG